MQKRVNATYKKAIKAIVQEEKDRVFSVEVKNIVCTVSFGENSIDPKRLFGGAKTGYMNSTNFGTFLRFHHPPVTGLVFKCGKTVFVGARHLWEILCAIMLLERSMSSVDIEVSRCDINICNIVVNGKYPYNLDTSRMFYDYIKKPQSHPFYEKDLSSTYIDPSNDTEGFSTVMNVKSAQDIILSDMPDKRNITTAMLYLSVKDYFLALIVFPGGFFSLMGALSDEQIEEIKTKLTVIFAEYKTDAVPMIHGEDEAARFRSVEDTFVKIQERQKLGLSETASMPGYQLMMNIETAVMCSAKKVVAKIFSAFLEWICNKKVTCMRKCSSKFFLHIGKRMARRNTSSASAVDSNTPWTFFDVSLGESDVKKLETFFENHKMKHVIMAKETKYDKDGPMSKKKTRKCNSLVLAGNVRYSDEYERLESYSFPKRAGNPHRKQKMDTDGKIEDENETMRTKSGREAETIFNTMLRGPIFYMLGVSIPVPYDRIHDRNILEEELMIHAAISRHAMSGKSCQKAFVQCFKRVPYFDFSVHCGALRKKRQRESILGDIGTFMHWLYRILRNEMKNYIFSQNISPRAMRDAPNPSLGWIKRVFVM